MAAKIRLCFALCLCASAVSRATDNTDGLNGVVRIQSAKTLGKTKMNVGLGVEFQQSSDYVKGPTGDLSRIRPDDTTQANVIQDPAKIISGNFFLSMGILDFWDLAATLPLYYDWSGFGPYDAGLGDVEVISKFMLPPISFNKTFYEAILLSATIPTGMKGNGLFPRHIHFAADTGVDSAKNLYTVGYVTVKPMLALTLDLGKQHVPLQIHANFGGVFAEVNTQNTIVGGLAVEYTPVEFVTLFAEITAESRWSNISSGYDIRKDPLRLTPGIRITAPNGLYFFLTGDFSLSSKNDAYRHNWYEKGYTYSTGVLPDVGVQFTFGWNGFVTTQDRDHDGVPDNVDRCPDDSGPAASNGCPDPDSDKDGICDPWVSQKHQEGKYADVCKGIDKCPTQPEDMDGFQDDDGCPDFDNDGDGIPDVKDQCPNEPEDFDGFQDEDGCPDRDNDHDGIPDAVDKCPNEPEDLDGFEDEDGCPDIDNDMDGVPDIKDKCPNVAGPASNNGCPEEAPPPKPPKKEPDFPKQQVLRGVTFQGSTAELTFESLQWLDAIARTMKEFPEIEIEVHSYTDGLGKYASVMQSTQMRAEAVTAVYHQSGPGPRPRAGRGIRVGKPHCRQQDRGGEGSQPQN